MPTTILSENDRFQYIRDLPGCARNGKLGAGSEPLAAANIRDHCTSGVTPKADVQGFSLNFRNCNRSFMLGQNSSHFTDVSAPRIRVVFLLENSTPFESLSRDHRG